MLKITRLVAAIAIASAMATSPAHAESDTVATVNGTPIPKSRVDLRVKIVTAQGQEDSPELRDAIREDLVNIELMSQEAVKKGMDKSEETVQQLVLARQAVLVGAFVQDYVKTHPIDDAAIEKEYNDLKSSLGDKELNVRHILVPTEAEAKTIAEKLKKGGSFDKLAKSESKDPGSAKRGGDLGWVAIGNVPATFVKPFADALIKLNKRDISEPVQSEFGWHIIKLQDVRPINLPPLSDSKAQIAQRIQQKAVKQLIDDLRSKAKIEK